VRSQTADFWIAELRQTGVPSGPFNFPHEIFDEEQIVANEFVLSLEHSKLGEYKTYGTAIKMEKTPVFPTVSSPGLGEHTTQILGELGYSADHIEQLIRDGLVIQAE
jgi:formyl-CoA transferase